MEPTFPLFRLPENAIVQVLKSMTPNQLFFISLASSKSKNLVTSLGLRARNVEISIFGRISVFLFTTNFNLTLNFYNDSIDQNELSPVDITLPVAASFENQGTRIQPSIPLLSFSNWLNHVRTVFCYTKPPNVLFYHDCERFEVQSLKNAIGNVDVLYVDIEVTNVYSKEVLKHFNASNELLLERNPFEEACEFQQFFIQNYKTFTFYDVYSLDDMLLINSEKVNLYRPTTQKQFNQFVKHWIRGSNRRLQYMYLSIDDFVSREVFLKEIRYVDAPKIVREEICQDHGIGGVHMVVQIRRKDGTAAVITTNGFLNVLYVRFIVMY
ncbi:hypothetical protein CRE_06116 [Caenorhabditis remanei]|uniref:F-box domain-containing protein n=1 Tax=Caenorhabditis remanei TaxID=31234 RepID=E3NEE2_CAERE|nr:hypothetical protein CRE_06116 [Caenorhabditis remanei]